MPLPVGLRGRNGSGFWGRTRIGSGNEPDEVAVPPTRYVAHRTVPRTLLTALRHRSGLTTLTVDRFGITGKAGGDAEALPLRYGSNRILCYGTTRPMSSPCGAPILLPRNTRQGQHRHLSARAALLQGGVTGMGRWIRTSVLLLPTQAGWTRLPQSHMWSARSVRPDTFRRHKPGLYYKLLTAGSPGRIRTPDLVVQSDSLYR